MINNARHRFTHTPIEKMSFFKLSVAMLWEIKPEKLGCYEVANVEIIFELFSLVLLFLSIEFP